MSPSERVARVVPIADRRTAADDQFDAFVTRRLGSARRLQLLREARLTARPADRELARLKTYDEKTERLRAVIRAERDEEKTA